LYTLAVIIIKFNKGERYSRTLLSTIRYPLLSKRDQREMEIFVMGVRVGVANIFWGHSIGIDEIKVFSVSIFF